MNILIVGLGSMGRRRLRLLSENFSDCRIIGVDSASERRKQAADQHGTVCFESIDTAILSNDFDIAFVSTPPTTHNAIIKILLENRLHVFTELNLVSDGYQENIRLADKNKRCLFLSATFLYRAEPQFLIESIHRTQTKLNYSYHVGQYLPDWHPWESYKDFFVSDKRTNGCREIFAIELPWLIQAFGKVSHFTSHANTISRLPLGYPDSFIVYLEHETGHRGQIMVDVVTRLPVRHFEVFGEDIQMEWRGTPEQLWVADEDFTEMRKVNLAREIDQVEGYREFVVEDAYLREMKEFFAVCCGKEHTAYRFADDLYTLDLIDRIERQGV